jgi:hypothetical protein
MQSSSLQWRIMAGTSSSGVKASQRHHRAKVRAIIINENFKVVMTKGDDAIFSILTYHILVYRTVYRHMLFRSFLFPILIFTFRI